MNDFQEIRRLSLEWWRNLSEERQMELVKTHYPRYDFIQISTSSSMIQRMYEVVHQSSNQ